MAEAYGFGVTLPVSVDEALARVTEALRAEGFGVLTAIDVRATLRDKLGVEMPEYHILGVCNPKLAHRALTVDQNIGLLLPCNIVVRATPAGSRIDIADPEAMLRVTRDTHLDAVAGEAKERLQHALSTIEAEEQQK